MMKEYKENEVDKIKDEEQQGVAEELDTTSNKKRVILLAGFVAVIVVILVMIIVKISSKPKEVQESEPTVQTQVVEDVKPVEVKEEEPEPTVYEGIDMESTLPGNEWIKTFLGVIDEPKLVVYNDTNNKKMILEAYQEVEFAADDVYAVYLPDGMESMSYFNYDPFAEIFYEDKAIIMKTLIPEYVADGSIMLESVIKFKDGNYYTLTCTLIFKE